jgi:hypothetical protein
VTRIRIHSAGDNGAVKQSNSNSAASKAANEALTEQGVEQGSGGSGAYGGTQYAGQHASTDQSAASRARAVQRRPSNSVDSVRIDSPGDDGDVTQSNDNSASSVAGNAAATGQSVSQGGGSGSGSGVQASDQSASTSQDADSAARARQRHPSNSAGGTRISSPGGGGSIDQSNSNSSASEAANAAETVQNTAQGAGGETVRSTRCSSCSAVAGRAVQAAGQDADTRQGARSGADATQSDATNSAGGTRIGSEGDEGDVRQSNDNKSASAAGNKSRTWQTLTQAIAGLFGVQAAGQDATTRQGAASAADATQDAPCNTVAPVRLYSMGGLGSIGQYNANNGVSMAGNAGATLQQALQLV